MKNSVSSIPQVNLTPSDVIPSEVRVTEGQSGIHNSFTSVQPRPFVKAQWISPLRSGRDDKLRSFAVVEMTN